MSRPLRASRLALYRGLTAGASGDEAKVGEAKDPGSLPSDEKNRMNLALDGLVTSSPH